MIHRRIAKVKLRKGIASEANNITFDSGELVYLTDKTHLHVGDGVSKAGVTVGNNNYIVSSPTLAIPKKAGYGDIIFNPVLGQTVILDKDNSGTLIPLVITDDNCFDYYREQVKLMLVALSVLTGCITPPPPPPPPPLGVLTWVIQPFDVISNVGDLATFMVSAVGPGSITYQWSRKDTGQLLGKTSDLLRINPVGLTDFAAYQCVATDSIVGTASSNVAYLAELKRITTTGYYTIALGLDGTLSAWGNNALGNLGDGTTTNRSLPVKVKNLPPVKATSVGDSMSLALGFDGTLSAWGNNYNGQLGDGTTTDRSLPVKVKNLPPVKAIDVGHVQAYALGFDGTLSAWGNNAVGQLGDGTTTNRSLPVKVKNLPPVKEIFVRGNTSAYALGFDGTLSAWGNNYNGQLGDGTTTDRSLPVKVKNLPPVKTIAANTGDHVLALGFDGTLSAWGENNFGELGDRTTIDRRLPVKINLPPVKTIATGLDFSFALGFDGTLSAWGRNDAGQLGDGTTTNRSSPVKVKNLPPFKEICLGAFHTIALGFDGTLSAWGGNYDGQLGDGTTTNRSLPVKLPFIL
jgi:alpha-tubulin suppressor-like RCC1 family protein